MGHISHVRLWSSKLSKAKVDALAAFKHLQAMYKA